MTVSAQLFYKRREDIAPEAFEKYMIEKHVPLVREVMAAQAPQTYTMRFVARVSTGHGDRLGATLSSRSRIAGDAPVVLVGTPADINWDAHGEMVFKDMLHLQQGLAMMETPGGQRIKEDEYNFTDPDALVVVLMGDAKEL